jgi:hypothetical protein
MVALSNGWLNAPGVPLHPERSGAHRLTHTTPGSSNPGPWDLLWCAPEWLWTDLFGNRLTPEEVSKHRYVGQLTLSLD